MSIDWKTKFSERSITMKASAIRELLKLVDSPDIISLAGGMPDPKLFPKEVIAEISRNVFLNHGGKALQYGATEGIPSLRETLVNEGISEGIETLTIDNLIVTTASQQGLDLVSKIFINPGDTIIVEAPSYVGGLQAFHAFQANFETVPLDHEGIRTDLLEEKIKKLKSKGVNIKFMYLIPNFQNPAGVTLSLKRREEILEISHKYEVPIIEDDPYGEIRFEGETLPSLVAMDKIGNVIALRTFSKILAPGLRLGWIIAEKSVIQKLVLAKQASDLCSPSSTQYIADEFIREGHMKAYLNLVRKTYKEKKDVMLSALEKYFPKETSWTKPEGGMFVWVTVPEYINTDELFKKAIKEKVAYVVGSAFYPHGEDTHHIRLNFTLPTIEQIDEGVKRLGNLLKKEIRN
ncbi:MAG: PLP-dependent aminotransferase family protein [Caldisericaceae bacterium]|nr:PLP-dependent aminotransferase family protein [Caldisericaceae bacterium]